MNYLAHFGLREPPFGITPDTSYFYCCRGSQEALNTLLVAIGNGDGFVKVTGEVGAGKTLLCRKLLATLEEGWVTCYIPNPSFEPRTLMLALAEELELPVDAAVDQHHLLRAITKALLDMARLRKRVLVCIDESQSMPLETLEALRLLTNLETEKRKLLQVVLFGQPANNPDDHKDYGLATYNYHRDGSGVAYSSHLRPLLTWWKELERAARFSASATNRCSYQKE